MPLASLAQTRACNSGDDVSEITEPTIAALRAAFCLSGGAAMATSNYDEALRRLQNTGLTAEILRNLLAYDSATGVFSWRVRAGPCSAGSIAGSQTEQGYWVIGIGRKVYKAHRLAYLYMTGEWPSKQIDHRNIDHADNRWNNLRHADASKNKANNPGYRGRKYDLPKGVYRAWGCRTRPFVAQIRVRGENIYLGSHPTTEEAHAAYSAAANKYFGEFANVGDQLRRGAPARARTRGRLHQSSV
jgi:hypothetical protein